MKKSLLFAAVVFVHFSALADWKVTTSTDSMTDESTKTAVVVNNEGISFSLYRISEGGPAWGNFSLSGKMFDQVNWKKPPMYRIDKNKPIDLEKMKKLQENFGVHAYEWEPKWVNFLVWHGKEDEGLSNSITELMEGEKVVFRYYLSTGGHKDTMFTLKGASTAISEALGISQNIDQAEKQRMEEFKRAYINESKKCRANMATFKTCFAKVSECGKQSNKNAEKFNSCIR